MPIIACTSICAIVCMLPILITNFIMAGGEDACLDQPITNFNISFTLRTWLTVQAIVITVMAALILITAVVACISLECALGVAICTGIFLILLGMFNGAWNIIGEVMWWGQLVDTCGASLNPYMYFLMIAFFVSGV